MAGTQKTGSQETLSQKTGSQETPSQKTGSQETPSQKTGSQETPSREAGRAGSGPADAGSGARDEAAVSRFIERFAGVLFESGVPRMPARVFVALLTADAGRLTAAELGQILGVSPAAVSGGVRYLIQVGLVTGTGTPGSRRLYYSVPHDVWHRLLRMRDQLMTRWTETLREGARVVGAGTPAGDRLTESVEYFEFVTAELPAMLDRWDKHRAARRRPS